MDDETRELLSDREENREPLIKWVEEVRVMYRVPDGRLMYLSLFPEKLPGREPLIDELQATVDEQALRIEDLNRLQQTVHDMESRVHGLIREKEDLKTWVAKLTREKYELKGEAKRQEQVHKETIDHLHLQLEETNKRLRAAMKALRGELP